ncbi:MAG: NADH-quinone oxidoreductase subunit K [Candidatus Omnitrophica bacterium]|nr:NADH-quinone oxidoreductase subunit K [Candidatus Omnitrophota bacterium]
MNPQLAHLFWYFIIFIALIFIAGVYCILASFNLIRVLVGLEILIKAATLLIILAGYLCGCTALSQAIVITLIVIEIVVMVVAGGVAFWAFQYNKTIDPRRLSNLRG